MLETASQRTEYLRFIFTQHLRNSVVHHGSEGWEGAVEIAGEAEQKVRLESGQESSQKDL